jgi:dimeric dUTPase (all-alpha-NTP-PPase superfamily)
MQKLFDKQLKLDDIILTNLCKRIGYEMTHRSLINQRMLAVNVELGEFIKEKDHDKKLMEWVDIFHFVLSCGLALEIDNCIAKYDINTLYDQSVENMYDAAVLNFIVKFNEFANNVRSFKYWSINRSPKDNIEKHYFKCFLALFDIAKTMGYSVQEIKQAYCDKNRVNQIRQKEGY